VINSDKNPTDKNRQVCWRLPNKLEPSIELLENEILRFINVVCIIFAFIKSI
jgi:hypothetical protein